ncbi:MAG: tRNA (uridine(54)-C5)-methyltransferase TrmA [Porticoccaceae bacterium]|nr:tRNA (uridine(54)-C5)-methyltransferase TrmA [Porticoccaceae bacterium]
MLVDPHQYQCQLDDKLAALRTSFAELELPPLTVFPSPPLHFRMRAEFRIWHEGEHSHYAMMPRGGGKPQPICGFDIGSPAIQAAMPQLLEAIHSHPILRHRLYAVEFLTTRDGQVLVTLIYHKQLGDDWLAAASAVRSQQGIDLIGRSRKQKLVVGRDHVVETFQVDQRQLSYQQVESGFTQPNAAVNEAMLNWAVSVSSGSNDSDLLELYCGNGNFTLALAANFRRVLATEVAKISVASALHNIALNNTDNIALVRMSSEEFTEAWNGVRPFRRLRDIDLASYRFSTIFVDPPRAGLDPNTLELARRFKQILYISCNPLTLRDNLTALADTHRIEKFAVFDQFPYTHHLECGALLVRR